MILKWNKKAWEDYIINNESNPGKNSTLYKRHKSVNLIQILRTGSNKTCQGILKRFASL